MHHTRNNHHGLCVYTIFLPGKKNDTHTHTQKWRERERRSSYIARRSNFERTITRRRGISYGPFAPPPPGKALFSPLKRLHRLTRLCACVCYTILPGTHVTRVHTHRRMRYAFMCGHIRDRNGRYFIGGLSGTRRTVRGTDKTRVSPTGRRDAGK